MRMRVNLLPFLTNLRKMSLNVGLQAKRSLYIGNLVSGIHFR